MISFGGLWASIWDQFFAAKASKAMSWDERLLLDAQIVQAYQQIHPDLHWSTEKLREVVAQGQTEPQIRRRLQVYQVSRASPHLGLILSFGAVHLMTDLRTRTEVPIATNEYLSQTIA
jgi:hypothetical protein